MQFVYRTTLGKGHLGLSQLLCSYLLRCRNFCVTIHTHLEKRNPVSGKLCLPCQDTFPSLSRCRFEFK